MFFMNLLGRKVNEDYEKSKLQITLKNVWIRAWKSEKDLHIR